MIPVPPYQVVQFLDWLRQRQVAGESIRRFDRDHLSKLAREYLNEGSLDAGKTEIPSLLSIFQSCPMITESTAREQMLHFAHCGLCFSH